MHELSIASAVLRCAERHALGRPVVTVHLRVGALRQVVAQSLAFHWQIVTRGTVCEHAELELERVPARARCRRCCREWQLAEPILTCPVCAAPASVVAGEELEVESLEVEEVDARCTA